MKKTIAFLTLFLCIQSYLWAQDNMQVFVFDIAINTEKIELSNPIEIPHNEGYNNQPYFISNQELLFSSNNDGQADILKYNLETGKKQWMNTATEGGEYSPQSIPHSDDIAAVRLDPDGLQRLYRYDGKKGTSSLLIEDIQVAYFAFYNADNILGTVLNGETMDLVTIDLNTQTVDTIVSEAGRGIQRIPAMDKMSYTSVNESNQMDVYLWNMDSGESVFICQLPYGVQDYVWLNDSQILSGSGNRLFMYDTWGDAEWFQVGSTEKYGLKDITRMALSPDGKKLAVVGKKKLW